MLGQSILHDRVVEKLGGGMGVVDKAQDVRPIQLARFDTEPSAAAWAWSRDGKKIAITRLVTTIPMSSCSTASDSAVHIFEKESGLCL